MKATNLVFYGSDDIAAKEVAAKIRSEGAYARIRHAEGFNGEAEPCERVVVLPCVTAHDAKRVKEVYGDRVVAMTPNVALPPPPLPPAPPHPLDALAKDWRNGEVAELQRIAAVVSGRAVENKAQAVQVIDAALKARAAK